MIGGENVNNPVYAYLGIHCFSVVTEKFSEMKDEIPQAVIDNHVKNATNARAEKTKEEAVTPAENSGEIRLCQQKNRIVYGFRNRQFMRPCI